jgi:hypothetical protein
MFGTMQGKPGMIFTIEFFRIRPNDDTHATLDWLSVNVDDLDAATVKASLAALCDLAGAVVPGA